MLLEDNATTLKDSLKHVRKPHKKIGKKLKHAKEKILEQERHFEQHLVDKIKNNYVKGRGAKLVPRHGIGHNDKTGMDTSKSKSGQKVEKMNQSKNDDDLVIKVDENKEVGGFMVLGMHRSGTSMLSGLLVEGFGYKPGAPLIQPAYDNEKGFYELIPAVLQNDIFMADQMVDWATNVKNYDAELAYRHFKEGKIEFLRGTNALKVLNSPNMRPWLQKDPR